MKKRTSAVFIVLFTVFSAMAARMTIISYGIPHVYTIKSTDQITFDPTGLFVTVTSPGAPTTVVSKYYLGYSNCVKLDTVGGPITNFCVNNIDGTQQVIDFSTIDSIVFSPQLDESGDDDGDGLTNYQEIMLYGTDPAKKDSDGDGYDDKWELGKDPNVWNPVVANLPLLSVDMTTYPEIFLITESSSSQSIENTVSKGTAWTSTEGVTTTDSKSTTLSGMTSLEICNSQEAGVQIIPRISVKFQATIHQEFSYGTETTHSIESSRQVENQQSYEQVTARGEVSGITYTGGKLSVYVRVTNNGSLGYSLSNPVFTLYGISYSKGAPIETPLCDLTPVSGAGSFSLTPGASKDLQLKATNNLELDEVKKVFSFSLLKIGCSFPNVTYLLENGSTPVGLEKTMTDVMASTAQLIVDFDGAKPGQVNLDKKIATLTKFNPSAATAIDRYGDVYLGELLKTAGLTYTFDSLGFVDINGLKRNVNNVWVTQIIHPQTSGGMIGDTVEVHMGASSGPDSVKIRTGDLVFVSYTGDDDRDSVSNAVAKMRGIYTDAVSKPKHDYDGDGISNYREIYGWVPSGSTDTVHTSPKNADSDGDGIADGSDPKPLIPRLASSSNVKSLSVVNAEDSIIETISFTASENSKSLSTNVPCIPHFQVTVDTMPLWCKLTVNQDTLVLVYDTIVVVPSSGGKPADTLYRFIDDPLAKRNMIPLGTVTVKVITKPLDKGATKVWTISGKSGLVNVMDKPIVYSSPVATTTDGGKWWQQLRVQISCKAQYDSDPRATGYIVVRSTDNTKTFDVSAVTGPISGTSHNGWNVSKVITGDDRKLDFSYIDAGLISGTTYYYRVIPFYSADNVTFIYGSSSATAISDGVRTWKIMVMPKFSDWVCNDEGDGSGDAEIKWQAAIKKTTFGVPDTTTISFLNEIDTTDVKDGTKVVNDWYIVREFKTNDNVICWFWMYEDDDTYDDSLWNENVLSINIGTMINASDVNGIGASGPLTEKKEWDTGNPWPSFIPTSNSSYNQVHFWQQRSTEDEPTTVTINWYIRWWFE